MLTLLLVVVWQLREIAGELRWPRVNKELLKNIRRLYNGQSDRVCRRTNGGGGGLDGEKGHRRERGFSEPPGGGARRGGGLGPW